MLLLALQEVILLLAQLLSQPELVQQRPSLGTTHHLLALECHAGVRRRRLPTWKALLLLLLLLQVRIRERVASLSLLLVVRRLQLRAWEARKPTLGRHMLLRLQNCVLLRPSVWHRLPQQLRNVEAAWQPARLLLLRLLVRVLLRLLQLLQWLLCERRVVLLLWLLQVVVCELLLLRLLLLLL